MPSSRRKWPSQDCKNVADLKLYILMKWFAGGGVDNVPTDVFKPFAKLTALYDAVGSNAKVAEWNARFAK